MVSLIEDARVERRAIAELPGLLSLWKPFHVARTGGASIAVALMARLSRALIDPEFSDSNSWVTKGRELFEEAYGNDPDDQQSSRRIGGLLANDLGQMRLQFDAKTYVVEPPYRDDNLGLWEFDEDSEQAAMEMELMLDSVRLETEERNDDDKQERDEDDRGDDDTRNVSLTQSEQDGLLVARYPEYDHVTGHERPDWCSVREYAPKLGDAGRLREMIEARPELLNRLKALIRASRVSLQKKLRRQAEGEFLDLDACIDATISRRSGEVPDSRVYSKYARQGRDLSILLLVDISKSTGDRLTDASRTVLDIERHAAAVMGQAMAQLDDPFAIASFCSDTRDDVHYQHIKDFAEPFGELAFRRLAGLESDLSTRLGPVIRHAAADLARQRTHRRILLIITDGEPSDIDVDETAYLVEDARTAVHSLNRQGIDVFCMVLDADPESHVERIFGRQNVMSLINAEYLPDKLVQFYFQLSK